LGAPRLLHHEPGAASYFAVGGVRVRIRASDAVAGEQPFASTLVGGAPGHAGGWLFVTASGTVARAEDFVGPLTFVQSLGRSVVRAFPWQGGLAAVFADGTARTVGPGGAAVPSSAPTSPAAAP